MIRYEPKLTRTALAERIRAASPTFEARAKAANAKFKRAGRFEGGGEFWADVKDVFIAIQRKKCAYCEKRMSDPEVGSREYDVEHFRPKGRVNPWPPAAWPGKRLASTITTGGVAENGYYRLAYDPQNYAVACATCNQSLKRDFFPVAADRDVEGDDVVRLNAREAPLLLFPIGSWGDDPESVLEFDGITPVPTTTADAHGRKRAEVTRDFFLLDIRDDLLDARAQTIAFLHTLWTAGGEERQKALKIAGGRGLPHASCARSFLRLVQSNPARARRMAALAMKRTLQASA